MPRKASCECGSCDRCRNRLGQQRRRARLPRRDPRIRALRRALAGYCRGVPNASEALADLSGLSAGAVTEIRQKQRLPSEAELDALCVAIGLHPELLYLYAEEAA